MRRINFKLLLALIIGAAILGGGLLAVRRWQVSRNAGGKLETARQRLAEGKSAEALDLLAQYVALRPQDDAAFAEYAKLLLGRASATDATRNDISRAFSALENAVRRNPEDDDLRRQVAEFELRVGRPVDALEHLNVLEQRLAANPPGDKDDQAPSPLQIQLLKATACAAAGEFEEAARIAAEITGYDLAERTFRDDLADAANVPVGAYTMLAGILRERFSADSAGQAVLEQLVARLPDDPQAWLALAAWLRDRGQLEEAAESVARAKALAPDDVETTFAEFELALAKRDWPQARALGQRALELFPSEERAYRGMAAVAMQTGDLARAEQVLLEGVERLPGRASLLLMLADSLLQQNKLIEAGQAIARIRDLYGATSPPVVLLEARLLVAERRWSDAKLKLEQIRPLVLGNAELVRQVDLYLGQCHAQLNEFDAQLQVNRRILNDDPNSLAARVGAAQALLSAGQAEQARAEFEAIAAALSPDQLVGIPQIWYPLLQLRIGRQISLPKAERDWTVVDSLLDALDTSPAVSPSQLAVLRAEALAQRGELAAARELLTAAAEGSAETQPWAALAGLVLRVDGPQAAFETLARVPAAIRDVPQLLAVEAQALAGAPQERARAGMAEIEKRAAGLPPEDTAGLLDTLATLRIAAGDLDDAERLWRAAAEKQPQNVRIRESLLDLALSRGDLDKARDAAADVARSAGPGAARGRVAEASVRVFEARRQLSKSGREGGPRSGASGELPAEVQTLLDAARSTLIEAEAERPGWMQVQLLLADIDALRGNREAAIGRLQRAVAAGPVNPSVVRRLVAMLYSANRLEEAQQAMALLGDEGAAGLERISAEVELRAGKLDAAVALAEQSVAGDTQNVEDLLWLGQLLARSGKTERAGEVLERAAEVAADSSEVWLALFSQSLTAANPAGAERALAKAAALVDEPQRQLLLAQGYAMLGREADAERQLREGIAGWPANLEVLRAMASFEIRKGRQAEARSLLDTILATSDEESASSRAWARRARAEMAAGRGSYLQLEEALALLRDNRDREGGSSADDLALEFSLLAGRPEPASWRQAIKRLDDLAAIQPLTTSQRLQRVQLNEKIGRWTEARDELIALIAKPETPPAYVAMLVEKLLEHGEISSGQNWLRRLKQTAPESAITVALEAKLALAENDRTRAVEFARRLMPGASENLVPSDQPAQLAAVARLMEDLAFTKAAERVLEQYAALNTEGSLARIDFLARQGRSGEALDQLESIWNTISLERGLATAVQVVRMQVDESRRREAAARVRRELEKAKRIDPGSLVIRLLDTELISLDENEADAERSYRTLLASTDLDATQRAIVSNNLAFHLATPATVAEAGRLIEAAIAELGPLPDLLDTRGLVRLVAGDVAGAVADLREACLQPSATKFLHLAAAELAAGDERAARLTLAKARAAGIERLAMSPADADRLRAIDEALAAKPAALPTEPEPASDE